VRLSGTWLGTVQLERSTDAGGNWYAITRSDGAVKGVWSSNVNAIAGYETCAGAIYRLKITLSSGSISYEVRQ